MVAQELIAGSQSGFSSAQKDKDLQADTRNFMCCLSAERPNQKPLDRCTPCNTSLTK